MAKGSQRRPVRYAKDQLGCIWGLMSIFDFRHGRLTRKMLSDRRRCKLAAGAGNPIIKLDMSTWIDNNEGAFDIEESRNAAADDGKPSVKKLIEEEMINEQDTKKEINNAEVEPKHFFPEEESPIKKARKRMRKNRKKSCDNSNDMGAPESLSAEQHSHQKSEHQFTSILDSDKVMEEFCHQIHQKSISYMNHEQPGESHVQSNQTNPNFEDKLREAIKLLTRQKQAKGKQLSEDGEIHPSKELMDALQILGSDGELSVKHLQDPYSLLVKCVQNFPDAQSDKDEDSMSLAGSTLSEKKLGNLRQSDELVNHKQRRFFSRKVKYQERCPTNGEKTSQASNRIVILKPGLTGSQNYEGESTVGSSQESHYVLRNKVPNERIGSQFFLTEIKRKLKYAMGKEHHTIQKGVSHESQKLRGRDRGIKENVGINSPTKDHFFIEKIARPVGAKKVDKAGKLKDSELGTEHRIADLPNQRMSNIYMEAKKHLFDMLSTGDENLEFSSGHVPKNLRRILSLPEYNFSPVGSPGRNWGYDFVTAKRRYVDPDRYQKLNENTSSFSQDNLTSHLGQTTNSSEIQPCTSDESSDNKVQFPTFNSTILVEQTDNEVKEASFSGGDEMNSIVNVEIIKTNEIVVQEESDVLDAPSQPTSASCIKDDDCNGDESEICNGQRHCKHITEDLETSEDNQLPSSPLASSPSNSLITKKVEAQETAIDILERPSPVSVLEPLYAEDDISPASSRSHAGDVILQPRQIQFEECASLAAVQSIQMKSSTDDKESTFEYVKAVVQTSDLNWDELCMKSFSTDQLLRPSLFDEIEFLPNQLCYEHKLLFDIINEVLMEICGHYFGCSPWVSFVKPYIRPVPDKKNALHEVWEGVLPHLIPPPLPHTLDQTVRKDMAKSGTWMDLRFDTDSTCIEMGDAILEELMDDTILSCVNECPERGCLVVLAELKEGESCTISENGCPLLPAELKEKDSSICL